MATAKKPAAPAKPAPHAPKPEPVTPRPEPIAAAAEDALVTEAEQWKPELCGADECYREPADGYRYCRAHLQGGVQ